MSWQGAGRQAPAPGWYGDPSRRFEQRYWDGGRWTEHVVSQGRRLVDPPPDQRQTPQPQPQPVAQAPQPQPQAQPQPAVQAAQAQPQFGAYPPGYQPGRRLSARNLVTGRYAIPGRVGPGVEAMAARAQRTPVGKSVLQTGAVLLFIVVLAFGGYVVGLFTSLPREAPVQVGSVVTVTPLSGWNVARNEAGAVLLTRGSANLKVVTGPAQDAKPSDLVGIALDALKEEAHGPLLVGEPASLTIGGHPATRVAYQGQFSTGGRATIIQGELTAVISPAGNGVLYDSWSLPEIYPYQEGDVHTMIEEAKLT